MKQPLVEKIDFYYNEQGYMVFTEKFHLDRGYCCGNGCRHCPYDFEKVPEPKRTLLLANRKRREEDK
ncbi:DUF5522 domain-containing protein [Chitinophaga sp. Hz27]|uniref:DUF5522 domain-containing protein n=1 Tax=Chitinophaga sp. Hz27 TaxID=3347169 RepID=UPI0035E39A77